MNQSEYLNKINLFYDEDYTKDLFYNSIIEIKNNIVNHSFKMYILDDSIVLLKKEFEDFKIILDIALGFCRNNQIVKIENNKNNILFISSNNNKLQIEKDNNVDIESIIETSKKITPDLYISKNKYYNEFMNIKNNKIILD